MLINCLGYWPKKRPASLKANHSQGWCKPYSQNHLLCFCKGTKKREKSKGKIHYFFLFRVQVPIPEQRSPTRSLSVKPKYKKQGRLTSVFDRNFIKTLPPICFFSGICLSLPRNNNNNQKLNEYEKTIITFRPDANAYGGESIRRRNRD